MSLCFDSFFSPYSTLVHILQRASQDLSRGLRARKLTALRLEQRGAQGAHHDRVLGRGHRRFPQRRKCSISACGTRERPRRFARRGGISRPERAQHHPAVFMRRRWRRRRRRRLTSRLRRRLAGIKWSKRRKFLQRRIHHFEAERSRVVGRTRGRRRWQGGRGWRLHFCPRRGHLRFVWSLRHQRHLLDSLSPCGLLVADGHARCRRRLCHAHARLDLSRRLVDCGNDAAAARATHARGVCGCHRRRNLWVVACCMGRGNEVDSHGLR